jgi:hypothetical protein
VLFVVGLALTIALPAAAASFVSAALLVMVLPMLRVHGVGYWRAYAACFFAIAAFLAVAGGVLAAAMSLQNPYGPQSFALLFARSVVQAAEITLPIAASPVEGWRLLAQHRPALLPLFMDSALLTLAFALLALYGPALLAAAVALNRTLRRQFRGLAGLPLSCIATALSVVPGLVLTLWGFAEGVKRVQLHPLGQMATAESVAVAAALLGLVYVLAGGVLGAVAVYLMMVLLRAPRRSYAHAVGTTMCSLFVYGLAGAVALTLFRDGDDLLRLLHRSVVALSSGAPSTVEARTVLVALQGFVPLQLPGLLASGAIIAARHHDRLSGFLGYIGACGLALLIVLPSFLSMLAVGMVLLHAGLLT